MPVRRAPLHLVVLAACALGLPVSSAAQAPAVLRAERTGAAVHLIWVALEPGVESWIVESGSGPGLSDLGSVAVPGSETDLRVPGVPPGTYFVRVRAVRGTVAGLPSNEVVVTVEAGPPCEGGVVSLSATLVGRVVTLRWTGPADSDGYILEAGAGPGRADIARVDLGSAESFTATAAPGTYFVRVRARRACGPGPASNEVVVQVAGPAAPGPCLATDTVLTRSGVQLAGTITDADCASTQRPGFRADLYRFTGGPGAVLIASARTGLLSTNPFLALAGPDGRLVAEANGFLGLAILNAVALAAEGEYVLEVGSARADGRFAYTLELRCVAAAGCP